MSKWNEPQGADYASDEPEFMVGYGRALADWGSVEHVLSRIYVKLLKPHNDVHATVAFFAVQNFRDRREMVNALVECHYGSGDDDNPHPVAKEWKCTNEAIGRTVKHRNRFAHLFVYQGPDMGTFGHGHIFELVKLGLDPEIRKRKTVGLKTLADYRQGFKSLYERLDRFRKML